MRINGLSALIFGSLIALAWAAPVARGQTPSTAPQPAKANYQITIDGTATTVGKWSCSSPASVVAKPPDSPQPAVPGLPSGVKTVVVTASVPAIDCGDSTMNKHLNNALKGKNFPEIRYQASGYSLLEDGTSVRTSGELTIAGVTKPVDLVATLTPLPEGGTRVAGKADINMKDYGVKPPSLFLGVLKVNPVVTVHFNTVVRLPEQIAQSLLPKQ